MANRPAGAGGARRSNQTIVLLADGTGNSSGALCKTNVWRLYQALDLGPPPAAARRQIVYYHDGVGTSSFKPLAVLGGAFGWGLKRNILDLYTFLCRNYTPGDRIYAFGFSRGAFTIRLLIGLVVSQGILDCSEEQLAYATRDAYRKYRYSFNQTGGLVGPLRWLRDRIIHGWRRLKKQTPHAAIRAQHPDGIDFVGVWDTVAAYGTPLAEMTRGIDNWVWPLSMPNYRLSEKVKRARHALALDDERDTFHPLLWDEQHEHELVQKGTVQPDRLQQVWFSGMHSDVGGGYPDDALAHVPLDWMISEASATGLRFDHNAVATIKRAMNESGPIHDSRRGVAGYYRYQPRKLSARIEPRDPNALIMEDPDLKYGLLRSVHVHASVLNRIRRGTDGYAPIVLPRDYGVVGSPQGPSETPAEAATRTTQQEYVWNQVWRKRVTYFATVAVSLLLAALPLIQNVYPPAACQGPQCLLAPLISAVGVALPGFARPWLEAFARAPGIFALIVAALAFLLLRNENLQRRIRDDMHTLWASQTGAGRPAFPTNWIYRLRTNRLYQRGLQSLKWKVVPCIFGWLVLAGGLAAIAAPVFVVAARVKIAAVDRSNQFCSAAPATKTGQGQDTFDTRSLCWPTGSQVSADTLYRVNLHVTKEWFDTERIPASPMGFGPERMQWGLGYLFIPFRRSITNRWFQPLAKVISDDGSSRIYPLEMQRSDTSDVVYTGDLKPTRGGAVFLFVNDALLPWGGSIRRFYENNAGEARVWLTRVPER